MDAMQTSAKKFVEHWNWAADKGAMNRNSANGIRAACMNVLSALENWEDIDMQTLDLDDTVRRFYNLKGKKFSQSSMKAYESRFRNAVASFLEYVRNPSGWKAAARPARANGQSKKERPTSSSESHEEVERIVSNAVPAKELIPYPFPLREDVVARLMLPRDITATEAKRLYGFMLALAVDVPDPK